MVQFGKNNVQIFIGQAVKPQDAIHSTDMGFASNLKPSATSVSWFLFGFSKSALFFSENSTRNQGFLELEHAHAAKTTCIFIKRTRARHNGSWMSHSCAGSDNLFLN